MKDKQLRIIEAALELSNAPKPGDLAFSARELVQATLPHQTPKGNPPVWQRSNGNYTLRIHPAYTTDPKTGEPLCIGYPFGVIPRLLMFWINTEAVRTKQRRIRLADSLTGFMLDIGLNPNTGGGKRSDARRLKDQMMRLFGARISFDYVDEQRKRWLNMEITSEGELWWDPRTPDQLNLFGSWIELGERFFDAITSRPVPVDTRALRALKTSPLALDFYAWLSYRVFTVAQSKRKAAIPWKELAKQVGSDYSRVKDFKRHAKVAITKILTLYPSAPVEIVNGGIEIKPGPLLISQAKVSSLKQLDGGR